MAGSGTAGERPAAPRAEQPNLIAPADVPELTVRFWLLIVGTGLLAGLAGAALMALLSLVEHLTYGYRTGDFLAGVEQAGARRRVLALSAAGVLAGAGAWALRRFTGPGGSEVSTALWLHQGRMPFARSVITALVSIVTVGMGASLGREAGPRQAGAALAGRLSDWAGLTSAHRRLLVACGAGAGMACVYNVPLGGALLTLEVMLGSLSLRLVLPVLTTSWIATAMAWTVLPATPTYRVPEVELSPSLMVFAAVLGPVAGLVAVAWVRLVRTAFRHRPRAEWLPVVPVLVFAAVGLLAVPYPQLLGNGKDIVQVALDAGFAVPTLAALLVLKPLATAGSLGSGASGGLFTPTIACGALLGSLAGQGWTRLWPGAAAGYPVVGAAALLAAALQAPVAAVVMMLELTRRIDALMVPMLIAVTGAMVVSRRMNTPSIYSVRLPAQ